MLRTKKLVLNSILVALSAIFSYVEALIPIPLGVPGIKLGLANIVIVFALYQLDYKSAAVISVVRVIVVSSLFGNPTMALYSLAGTAVSLFVMILLKITGKFSIIGVSMAGGVFHNAAQVTVAVLTVKTIGLFTYLPALILAGMLTGILIGIVSEKAIGHLSRIAAL